MEPRVSFIRLWNDRRGSSFIETGILIPTMLFLCCGTMDFVRVVYAGIEIENAAQAVKEKRTYLSDRPIVTSAEP